ncbi:MAG TPA: type II secretion system ATPase GspE [Terriglobales bacterium]|nr:type II secretion system ATPase GspE [Terriglobales bacterium]
MAASAPIHVRAGRKFLGEILSESGKVTAADLERALELQQGSRDRLGKLLVDLGVLAERDLLAALSEQLDLPVIEAAQFPSLPPEIKGLSPRFMRAAKFFPFDLQDGVLHIAVADPLDYETLDSIRLATACEPKPYLALESEVLDAIEKFFGAGAQPGQFDRLLGALGDGELALEAAAEDVEHLRDLALEAPVIRYVNMLIARAVESRASDIHIEPMEDDLRVRFRIDGVLYPIESPAKAMAPAIISRIKLTAKLNIAERRLPQDGRIRLRVMGRDIDLRVSSLPTLYGESVVMRILERNESKKITLSSLGFNDLDFERMKQVTARPHGIFLVTGPTGSGKTTTLYAALSNINQSDKKIITLEDPVEYQMSGVNQMHVNTQIGLTFASGLRSILRQDPDVIMVGEIRDLETAEIAIRAALTGHLVFSTLHTNDAPSAITRLVDMGVPAYLISSSVLAVLAQRLVRVLCSECKHPEQVSLSALPSDCVPAGAGRTLTVYRAVGCAACRNTGFRGRLGIFEFMIVDEPMQSLVARTSESNVLREHARKAGMRTLRQSGYELVLSGATTIDEVLRVTQEEAALEGAS